MNIGLSLMDKGTPNNIKSINMTWDKRCLDLALVVARAGYTKTLLIDAGEIIGK